MDLHDAFILSRARKYATKYLADGGPVPATAESVIKACSGCVLRPENIDPAIPQVTADLVNSSPVSG
jgi:hypothetical protein